MATLQNSVQNTTEPNTFQDVYASCYSHGLESIYKIENVDVKSIRKLNFNPTSEQKNLAPAFEEWIENQFSFNLGPFFQSWMTPYTLQEPINVLQLPKPLEKNLLGQGFKTIGLLQTADLYALKLGQGHIEDIKTKLKSYIHQKPLEKTRRIDFLSLLKCLFADRDPCKVYVLLEPFGLHEWIILSPSETMEIRRSAASQKEAWKTNLIGELQDEWGQVKHFFTQINATWVAPWIYARGGIATDQEVKEYLILRSKDESYAEKALALFYSLWDIGEGLNKLDDCFTSDPSFFLLIEQTAKTYFVNIKAEYSIGDLADLVSGELSSKWISAKADLVIKVLERSSHLLTFRKATGDRFVKLNYQKTFAVI